MIYKVITTICNVYFISLTYAHNASRWGITDDVECASDLIYDIHVFESFKTQNRLYFSNRVNNSKRLYKHCCFVNHDLKICLCEKEKLAILYKVS